MKSGVATLQPITPRGRAKYADIHFFHCAAAWRNKDVFYIPGLGLQSEEKRYQAYAANHFLANVTPPHTHTHDYLHVNPSTSSLAKPTVAPVTGPTVGLVSEDVEGLTWR